MEPQIEVTKIDANNFSVEETIARPVNKKELKKQIDELIASISNIKAKTGIIDLETDLEIKQALYEQLK